MRLDTAANGLAQTAWREPRAKQVQSLPLLALPNKPSIAVLPFTNLSGDPEQGYFADGMVEEIVTALIRIQWLCVIARNSSFTYKGQNFDVKQVGHELGVRYVLEGSVRKGGGRVRITAQLIEAETGTHLWADRFDGSLEGVFELQEMVALSVVGVIEPTLQSAETARSANRPTSDLTAYDAYLRAYAMLTTSGEKRPSAWWDQVGTAIAKADGGHFESDPARYRRLALAALKPLTRPTEAMVDAAHEVVWFDAFWAINSRADFKRAVWAMIRAAMAR